MDNKNSCQITIMLKLLWPMETPDFGIIKQENGTWIFKQGNTYDQLSHWSLLVLDKDSVV